MNIFERIKSFETEYDYFEKDTYKSVFSAHHIIMDYYTQKSTLEIKCLDDIIDAMYASYAYELIHDPKTVQEFCPYHVLLEYSSILYRYLEGENSFQVLKMVNLWVSEKKNENNPRLRN